MGDFWLYSLLVIAVATGWWLGRLSVQKSNSEHPSREIQRQYYRGLNYLLGDQPDAAIDAFVESLEVNSDTLETHLAVGNLMRRKGEVERAIRIHQNLLARPSLSSEQRDMSHIELARDYVAAGLLDRAERLLLDLSNKRSEFKPVALKLLLEIYRDEREWQQAIDVGQRLLPRRPLLKQSGEIDESTHKALAHFCCELVEEALAKQDYRLARQQIKAALGYDRQCVRASLLAGEVEYQTGHYRQALKMLHRVRFQEAEFIPEVLPLIVACYTQLQDRKGLYGYLLDCLSAHPSVALMLEVGALLGREKGVEAEASFIGQHLKQRPSLKGLSRLIELHIGQASGVARDNLAILQSLIDSLLEQKPAYQCQHCGFSGRKLHWLCPSCKEWEQIRPIRGVEGD